MPTCRHTGAKTAHIRVFFGCFMKASHAAVAGMPGKAWHDQKAHGGVRADDGDGEHVACPACGLDGVKAP